MPRYSIPTLFSRALSAFGSGVQKRFATTKIPPAGQLFLRNIVEEKAIKYQKNQLASGLADLPIQVREAARNKAHKEVRKKRVAARKSEETSIEEMFGGPDGLLSLVDEKILVAEKQRYNSLLQEAEEEIGRGEWSRIKVRDGNGRVVFDGVLPISFNNPQSKLLQAFQEDGSRSNALVPVVENSAMFPANYGKSLTISAEKAVFERDAKDIMIKKQMIDVREDRSMGNNIDFSDRVSIFLITNLEINLNLREGTLTIPNLEEVREKYIKNFGHSWQIKPEDFDRDYRRLVEEVVERFAYIKDEQGKTHSKFYSETYEKGDFDGWVSTLLKKAKGTLHRSSLNQEEENAAVARDNKTHLTSAVHRHDDILSSGNLFSRFDYSKNVMNSLVISAYVEDAAKVVYGEQDCDAHHRQINFANVKGSVAFPRDYSIYYDGCFHQTSRPLVEAMAQKEHSVFSANKSHPTIADRHASHGADIEATGFKTAQDIPFDAKGGNMILTQNVDGKKVLLATVSDSYFTDAGNFQGGFVIGSDGKVEDQSNSVAEMFSSVLNQRKYSRFRQQIIDWGKSIGCDEVVVLDRNIEMQQPVQSEGIIERIRNFSFGKALDKSSEESKAKERKFQQLYHLDIFCGELPGGYLVINPEAVSKENMAQLKQIFGEDKIVDLSWEEQQALCGNFIVFDRTVVVSSPRTPTSFIDKIHKLRFDVYVPPIELTTKEAAKSGFLAGIRCLTISTDGSEKLKYGDINPPILDGKNSKKLSFGLSEAKAIKFLSASLEAKKGQEPSRK
jgi:hypothetical protein